MENKEEKGIFRQIYDWFKNLTVKGLLKAILVAFIIIIILLSLSYLPNALSRISNSLSAALYSVFVPAENATMTADQKIINSGEDFTVSFKPGDLTNGIFTISYPCDSSVNLLSVETNSLKKITCATPYYLLENETAIKIKALTQDGVVRLVLTGSFENNDTQKTDTIGVVRVTVKNDSVGTVVAPPATTSQSVIIPATSTSTYTPPTTTVVPPYIPSQPAPTYPTYYGKPDLAIRILQVGLLNNGTNFIANQSQFTYSDLVGIKFEVRNDGGANTGPWSFTAVLPSLSTPTYNSNAQISLKPGDSIIFTLGFSNLTNQYSNLITINVDPQNLVSESAEYNNIATQTITNTSYNSNYYNNNYNNNYNTNGYYDSYGNWISYNNYNYNNYNTNGYYDAYGNWISYNNYNNYNNYNTYGNLGVTCYGSPNNVSTGDRVHWYANAFGGNGDYNYSWSGTNSLSSSSQNPSKVYNSSGTKNAVVTVESDGYYVSHTCSVYVD